MYDDEKLKITSHRQDKHGEGFHIGLKQELISYLKRMTDPLNFHFSEDGTKLHLGAFAAGYGFKIADMEGLSRLLWGLTPLYHGGGDIGPFKNIYKQALVNGTDPKHKGYWGKIGDRDQRVVEMAAISLNLLMTPEWIWSDLKQEERKNLAGWLNQTNFYKVPDNNWHFFNVMVNLALKKLGMPYDSERMAQGIDSYESFYLGDGWYSDGIRPQKDYYVSFGIHYYCLLYAMFMKDEDPVRSKEYLSRAHTFAKTFIYWFDSEGKALPFGRSMTYRFAQVAFWSIFVTLTEDYEMMGVAKGIIARNFRYWMMQPITDNAGVLTVGYCYPNLNISEGYNSAGSPYWAFKSFLCLSLDDDHPFWKVEEKSLPQLNSIKSIPACDMIMQQRFGEVVALTAGQFPTVPHTHSSAKYAKFAYSSEYGFSVPRSALSLEETAPDSMLAFVVNGVVYVRSQCQHHIITDTYVDAVWQPVPGITVETRLIPTELGHERHHYIKSDLECEAYDCGFSYPVGENLSSYTKFGRALVQDDNGSSEIYSIDGEGIVIKTVPNTNLIFPLAQIPCIRYHIKKGEARFQSTIATHKRNNIKIIGKGDCYGISSDKGTNV